jgi:hypothetical protein
LISDAGLCHAIALCEESFIQQVHHFQNSSPSCLFFHRAATTAMIPVLFRRTRTWPHFLLSSRLLILALSLFQPSALPAEGYLAYCVIDAAGIPAPRTAFSSPALMRKHGSDFLSLLVSAFSSPLQALLAASLGRG